MWFCVVMVNVGVRSFEVLRGLSLDETIWLFMEFLFEFIIISK
jgi:hypothetical protein